MAWVPLAASAISAVAGAGKSSPAGPAVADQQSEIGVDFSGWNVTTGGSKSDSTAGDGLSIPPWLIFGVVGLLALAWIKKR